MTYEARDLSQQDGSPIECYAFIGPKSYFYTNDSEPHTIAGVVYEPVSGLERSKITISALTNRSEAVEVSMPISEDLMQDNAFAITPYSMDLTIYELHREDDGVSTLLVGEVVEWSVVDRVGSVSVIPRTVLAGSTIAPGIQYDNYCNHVLYDEYCKASRAANSTTATVVSSSPEGIVVDDDGFDDNTLGGGDILHSLTGERRLILDNLANTLTLSFPFTTAKAGDDVVISRGCKHNLTDCKTIFDNVANYGGFPLVPNSNPFVRTKN